MGSDVLSTCESAFRTAVIAAPEDDAPRLIFADWLEENDRQAQADFIRLQIAEYTLTPEAVYDADRLPELYRFRRSAQALAARYHRDWLVRHPPWLGDRIGWQRGFPYRLSCTTREFMNLGKFLEEEPIRELALEGPRHQFEYFLEAPHLNRITHLKLNRPQYPLHFAELGRLLRSPRLGMLQSLDVNLQTGYASTFARTEVLRLCEQPNSQGLRELALAGNNGMWTDAIAALVARAGLPYLRRLELRDCLLFDNGTAHLAEARHWLELEEIHLRQVRVGRDGLSALTQAQGFPRLRRLIIDQNGLDPNAMTAFLQGPLPEQLESLQLSRAMLRDDATAIIAEARTLCNLRSLNLSSNLFTPTGIEILCSSPHLGNLQRLSLSHNWLGDAGLWELLATNRLPNLRVLHLANCGLTRAGIQALLNSTSFPDLTELILGAPWSTEFSTSLTARFPKARIV